MSSNIYTCLICKQEHASNKRLASHLRVHNISTQQYYDSYIRVEGEGLCEEHGNKTRFRGLTTGYTNYCGRKCGASERTARGWSEERKRNAIPPTGGGRTKGSKNKNPYPRSAAVKRRFRESPPPSWEGKKHTEETKKKMSLSAIQRIERCGMPKSHKGPFNPEFPLKYKGNVSTITYRSSWELRFMMYLDRHKDVIQWSSEELIIPYRSPIDGRVRRYFPDFWVRKKNRQGIIDVVVVEIKPHYQTVEPKPQTRMTKKYLTEVKNWGINQAKWKAANEYCLDRGWKFMTMTEKDMGLMI